MSEPLDKQIADVITKNIVEIIAERLGKEPGEIEPGHSFADDLKTDSLTMAELTLAFEDALDLDPIPDQVVEKIVTVQDAIDYVVKVRG